MYKVDRSVSQLKVLNKLSEAKKRSSTKVPENPCHQANLIYAPEEFVSITSDHKNQAHIVNRKK